MEVEDYSSRRRRELGEAKHAYNSIQSFLKTGHLDVSPGRRQNMITPYFLSFLYKSNTEQIKVAAKV